MSNHNHEKDMIGEANFMKMIREVGEAQQNRGYIPATLNDKEKLVTRCSDSMTKFLCSITRYRHTPENHIDIVGGTKELPWTAPVTAETRSFLHEFFIRDASPQWIVEKLDGEPVYMEFDSCKDATKAVVDHYKCKGLIG